jgi:uncharacterized protein
MRRKEKEISDIHEIEQIIRESQVCRIAMCDGTIPYVIPMNFGYENRTLYLHCAREGRKINILKTNPRVCVEWDGKTELITADTACKWGMKYCSVIAEGTASFITTTEQKMKALSVLMKQYSDRKDFTFSYDAVNTITIIKIECTSIIGKKSGY